MTAKNEHTGDTLQSKVPSNEYRNNYDLIFRKKEEPKEKEAVEPARKEML